MRAGFFVISRGMIGEIWMSGRSQCGRERRRCARNGKFAVSGESYQHRARREIRCVASSWGDLPVWGKPERAGLFCHCVRNEWGNSDEWAKPSHCG